MVPAVKYIEGSDVELEGLAIPFDGPFAGKDIQGERFTPETDYAFDWFPDGRPIIYEHGIDEAMKTTVQGRQLSHEMREEGIWARGVLDKSAKYHRTVDRLLRKGALFFSSGSQTHLARVKRDGSLTRWPWIELSLTPTPAHPGAVAYAVKSAELLDHLEIADIPIPPGLVAAALKALDDEAVYDDDEGLPAGLKFADDADRVLADVEAFRTRTGSLVDLRAKSGRVLSASTRERLARHPGSLRELADDLDQLLSTADSEKAGKSVLTELLLETERTLSRSLGVTV